jgi:hypothetical protein
VNGWNESKEKLQKFVDKEKLEQKILLMGGTIADKLYRVTNYPTSFWINHEGRIVDREVGFNPEAFSKMEGHVERLLEAQKNAEGAGG